MKAEISERPPPSAWCRRFCSAFSLAAQTGCRGERLRAVSLAPAERRETKEGGHLAMNTNLVARMLAIAGLAAVAIALNAAPARAQQEFGSPELIAAAKAEGKLVYYTA